MNPFNEMKQMVPFKSLHNKHGSLNVSECYIQYFQLVDHHMLRHHAAANGYHTEAAQKSRKEFSEI